MKNRAYIIDTDAGVDDAIALIMALSELHQNILGITTVSGNVNVDQVTKNVGHILDFLDDNTPIFSGAIGPISGKKLSSSVLMGNDGFGDISSMLKPPARKESDECAAFVLLRLVRESDRPVTVVALGPLTNIALAVRLDPTFVNGVDRLIIMGGAVEAKGNCTPLAEFNFCCDPEAASIVLSAGFNDLWMVPWETSIQHMLPWDEYEKIISINTDKGNFVNKFSAVLVNVLKDGMGSPGFPMPDPLTMAIAIDPEIVQQEKYRHVEVETGGNISRGMVSVDWSNISNQDPNVHIVTGIKLEKFKEMLVNAFS